jgi:hypothetical protein
VVPAADVAVGTVPVTDDDADEEAPGDGDEGSQRWVPPARHVAADRAAALSLRAAQAISDALGEDDVPEEPVVINRRGPQRSIAALDRLLADAIEGDPDEDP